MSLMTGVFKNKYFKHEHFLEAQVGKNSSDIWRSLCEVRKVLMAGSHWRIGNGHQIRIFRDCWVKNLPDGLILGSASDLMSNHPVNSLIDWRLARLNEDMLRARFPSHIVSAIRSMPLANIHHLDQLIWKHNQNGEYTVKTAIINYSDEVSSHLLWIWKNRDQVIFDDVCDRASCCVYDVERWLLEFSCLQQVHVVSRVNLPVQLPARWARPQPGILKLNFDAAFMYGSCANSYGFAVRNSLGVVVHAEGGPIGLTEDAFHAETVAAWRAIRWATAMQVSKVEIEGDCKLLIDELIS
ncbi:uncharacterized protein [Rutidosis leptorrhynchoides]|uniref:uncharacterized protein n=1 Tax=Rutidosis leptorrhynchoides TaxID=125765 RepID=UPI003A9A5D22